METEGRWRRRRRDWGKGAEGRHGALGVWGVGVGWGGVEERSRTLLTARPWVAVRKIAVCAQYLWVRRVRRNAVANQTVIIARLAAAVLNDSSSVSSSSDSSSSSNISSSRSCGSSSNNSSST